MPTVTHTELIARIPLFAGLSPEQLASVVPSAIKKIYKRGQAILVQGEASQFLYILIAGQAEVVVTDAKGKEVILATLSAGSYLGEMSLLDGLPHSAHVVAKSRVDALLLARSDLLTCIKNHPEVGLAMMRALVTRLRTADEKIQSLALLDVYGRVARSLLDASHLQADGTRVITQKISKQTIAKMIGASREMVTKVFKALERDGVLVTQSDGSVRLQDQVMTLI